jgi:hypothetical protein
VPIDSGLQCVGRVRGLPATPRADDDQWGRDDGRLSYCKVMPAKCLVVVSAACLRHLRSLLGARARHVCTVRSRQPCVLELYDAPSFLYWTTYSLLTACLCALIITDRLDHKATFFVHVCQGPQTLMALDPWRFCRPGPSQHFINTHEIFVFPERKEDILCNI